MDVFLNLLTSHKRITEAILGSYFDYFSNIFVDACNAPGITLEDQSATLPAAELPPDSYVDWGAVHFYPPLNRTGEQITYG